MEEESSELKRERVPIPRKRKVYRGVLGAKRRRHKSIVSPPSGPRPRLNAQKQRKFQHKDERDRKGRRRKKKKKNPRDVNT